MWRKAVAWLIVVGALFLAGCNRAPSASFSADKTTGLSPLTVQFDGTGSQDPDGNIVSYEWDFGDGTSDFGVQVTHTFSTETDRNFNVRLTVTDNEGARGSHSVTIHVQGSNTQPDPGEVLFFDDFEDGMDPAWEVTRTWSVKNGVLHPDSLDWRRAYVLTGTHWRDYAADVDVDCGDGIVGIILRCSQDLQNYVMMRATHSTLRWLAVQDGETVEEEVRDPGLFEGENHVRVEVQGNDYTVYVEGLLRLQYTWQGRTEGMAGLAGNYWYGDIPSFDDFRVTALP